MTEDHIIKAVQSPPTACIAVQVRNQNEKSPWKTVFPKGLLVVLLTRPGLEANFAPLELRWFDVDKSLQ
jgi:hypothetical protein